MGLQTWVINLDRAPDRLARVSAQLNELGLPFHRLVAVDARALTPEQSALLDSAAYRRKHGMAPVLGELGCYLSHVQALRAFLASEAAFALVLEDDALLHSSLPAVLAGLQRVAPRWDMVKLSAVHSGTPVRVAAVVPGHDLAVMLSRCTGASAYVVNRRAAQVYVDGLLPMQLPVDHVLDRAWHWRLKVRLVTPTPCTHDDQIATTIGAGNVLQSGASRKFHWSKRLPTFAYRLGNELRRVAHGLGQVVAERRAG